MEISNLQKIEVLKKQFLQIKDIMILAECNRQNAAKILTAVGKEVIGSGMQMPGYNQCSTKRLIDFLQIDEKRIIRYAKLELELEEIKKKSLAATSEL